MTDREKQIEEIVKLLQEGDDFCVDVGGRDCDTCSPNRHERCTVWKQAKLLYNAGYRKADKVRGETANEILTYIGNMADECDDRFKLKNYHWFVKLCQKYGVIIDNNATH